MNIYRIIPYISLVIASLILFIIAFFVTDQNIKNILINVFSNAMFFFIVYIFYDLMKIFVTKKEKKYLKDYITKIISSDIYIALYYFKKVIHGYNLDTNKLTNIMGIVNYNKGELLNIIKNQNYLGFQIFKNTAEIHSLFKEALNDNLILKHSTHIDTINILKIYHNLTEIEYIFKSIVNYEETPESGVEYITVNGKQINSENDDKFLLLKKTKKDNRFVVYDSGYFDNEFYKNLLKRYILTETSASEIAKLLYNTFSLMKYWLPDILKLQRKDYRFRIIKDYFSPFTNTKTNKTKIFIADIIDLK